jgi:gamma-glutamylcyclotransferase (GGCT)/AIG2-like uncharacterized protein YtfP
MLVFVYGTLKRGHHNHRVLGPNPQFVGNAITNTKYKMLDAGFPVLLALTKDDKDEGHFVEGEVYDVDADIAKRLDQLEGKGRMYNRVRKYVKMAEGSVRLNYYVGIPQYWDHYHRQGFHTPVANGALNWPEGKPATQRRA